MNPGIGALWDQLVQAGVVSGCGSGWERIHPPLVCEGDAGYQGGSRLCCCWGVRDKTARPDFARLPGLRTGETC